MDTAERRLVLDEGFEQAITSVLDAFLCNGFCVEALDGGNLHRPTREGHSLRYALLGASLPELYFHAAPDAQSYLLGCRLSVYELTGSCTLVTVEKPLGTYPLLGAMVPRVTERIGDALRRVCRRGSHLEAA
jgi:hypothetical protein